MTADELAEWLTGHGWTAVVEDVDHVRADRRRGQRDVRRVYEQELTITGSRWRITRPPRR